MRIRAPLFISIILLIILCGCGSISKTKTNNNLTPVPTPTPVVNIIHTKIPEIKIVTVYWPHMIVDQSSPIEVALVSNTGSVPKLQTLEQAPIAVTEPTPVGTAGATVQQAFGLGFEPSATATLNAGTFKVLSTPSEDVQSLRQPVVEWDWNVTPQSTGPQVLSVDINIKWDPTQSEAIFFNTRFRIGNPQLSVDVTELPAHPVTPGPFITLGQIKLSDLITVVIGAVLSAGGLGTIFIIWLVKRPRNKNKTISSP